MTRVRFPPPAPNSPDNQLTDPFVRVDFLRCGSSSIPREQKKETRMFRGVTRSIIIISALMIGAPAVVLYGIGGSEWWEQMKLMSPMF